MPGAGRRTDDDLVAQIAAATVAWVSRVESLIVQKQRYYASRMLELQLELQAPMNQRCPARVTRVRAHARKALDDVRDLLAMLRDTLEQLPPQLTPSVLARASAGTAPTTDAAQAFIDGLPSNTHAADNDCPICLSGLQSVENGDVVALSCGSSAHCFHRACIRDWAKLSTRCPLCREAFGSSSRVGATPSSPLAASPQRAVVTQPSSPPSSPQIPSVRSTDIAQDISPTRLQCPTTPSLPSISARNAEGERQNLARRLQCQAQRHVRASSEPLRKTKSSNSSAGRLGVFGSIVISGQSAATGTSSSQARPPRLPSGTPYTACPELVTQRRMNMEEDSGGHAARSSSRERVGRCVSSVNSVATPRRRSESARDKGRGEYGISVTGSAVSSSRPGVMSPVPSS